MNGTAETVAGQTVKNDNEQQLRQVVGMLGQALAQIELSIDLGEVDTDERAHLLTMLGHVSMQAETIREKITNKLDLIDSVQLSSNVHNNGNGTDHHAILGSEISTRQEVHSNGNGHVVEPPKLTESKSDKPAEQPNSKGSGEIKPGIDDPQAERFNALLSYLLARPNQPVQPKDLQTVLPESLTVTNKRSIISDFFNKLKSLPEYSDCLEIHGKTKDRRYILRIDSEATPVNEENIQPVVSEAILPNTREKSKERYETLVGYMLSRQGEQIKPGDLWSVFPENMSDVAKKQAVTKFFAQLSQDPVFEGRLLAVGATSGRRYILQPSAPEELKVDDGMSQEQEHSVGETVNVIAETEWGAQVINDGDGKYRLSLNGQHMHIRSETAGLFARLCKGSIFYEDLLAEMVEADPELTEKYLAGMIHELRNFFATAGTNYFQDKVLNTIAGKQRLLHIKRKASDFLAQGQTTGR